MTHPRDEIDRRLAARRAEVARHDRNDAVVARARLVAFAAALAVAALAFVWHRASGWWTVAPLAAFAALVVLHDRVFSARSRAQRAVAFHERALARIEGRFAGTGTRGDGLGGEGHLYALDLDLFGEGSLFELLCAARTRPGEERLAHWLLEPARSAPLRARQRAVATLSPRMDLREDLAVLGDDVRAAVDASALSAWGEAAPLAEPWLLPASLALASAAVLSAAAWASGLAGPIPLGTVLLATLGFSHAVRKPAARILGGVERPASELRVLSLLLGRLEREQFDDAELQARRAALAADGPPASARIAALERTVARLEWSRNQLFAPVAFALSWNTLHASLIERWRRESGGRIRRWLDATADLEALSSLAGYAYEHPDDPFPEILDPGPERRARLDGEALSHPLLVSGVPNDARLGDGGPRVVLVSGSNMSGKSTYLRTVGVNVVLALAGAPVRAARMALTPVAMGATLRIQDSLQAGRSRFYAEIMRLKELSDVADGDLPLLFLLDEILQGTNSHDRRIGAEAVVRGLVAKGALGLVTTHDLALTELAGEGGALANAHFEDHVQDGAIAFDYRLKPGVVSHSNALALMRAVGLRV